MYLFRVIDIVITLFTKLVKFKMFDLSVLLEIDFLVRRQQKINMHPLACARQHE